MMLTPFVDWAGDGRFDLVVVGGGPVGIAVALAAEDRGLSVLLIESGDLSPSPFSASLSQASLTDPATHADMEVAVCRGLGGTSRWWGGRCVPYDEVDFRERPQAPDAAWPIDEAEVRGWYRHAVASLGCGTAGFTSALAPWTDLGDVRFDQLELWAPEIDMGRRHLERLRSSPRIKVLLGATATILEVAPDGSGIRELLLKGQHRVLPFAPNAPVVLACGGLETTRLLLAAAPGLPSSLTAGSSIGRGYMGHISGKIADIVLSDPEQIAAHDYYLDGGIFVRRRFTLPADVQLREGLLNIAFWTDNPPMHDAKHRSGVLSLVWLALTLPVIGGKLVSEGIRQMHVGPRPRRYARHVGNILADLPGTVLTLARIIQARYVKKPRKPGFIVGNKAGRYALHYHAEQLPRSTSRVRLGDEVDALGARRLAIDYAFSRDEAVSVVKAHAILDGALKRSGLGRLDYYAPEEARLASVLAQGRDGFHQIGTTRMGLDPRTSTVDRNCKVHGVDGLFIASSSVFASSGQANPTLLAVAMAFRLVDHLAKAVPVQDSPAERRDAPAPRSKGGLVCG